MCIIVSKEKGLNIPSREVLKNCFDTNSDGAGMMYVEKGKVIIDKGYMTFDAFYDRLTMLDKKLKFKDRSLVMHFRISTGGNVDQGNCHPYPITDNRKRLRDLHTVSNLAMVHNGVISDYSRLDTTLNDTQMFVKDCVSVWYNYDKNFCRNSKVMDILEKIAGSKLCFLDNEDNLYYVGKFIDEGGIMYSNTSYLDWSYPTVGKANSYSSWGKAYDKYSDYGYGEYDVEDITEYKNYEDIYMNKIEKGIEIEDVEMEVVLDSIHFLEDGTIVQLSTGELVAVDEQMTYAIDWYENLVKIDWYDNCFTILKKDGALDIFRRDEVDYSNVKEVM